MIPEPLYQTWAVGLIMLFRSYHVNGNRLDLLCPLGPWIWYLPGIQWMMFLAFSLSTHGLLVIPLQQKPIPELPPFWKMHFNGFEIQRTAFWWMPWTNSTLNTCPVAPTMDIPGPESWSPWMACSSALFCSAHVVALLSLLGQLTISKGFVD